MREVYRVTDQNLVDLLTNLKGQLESGIMSIRFPNPKSPAPYYEGELYELDGQMVRFRSLRAWLEICEILEVGFQIDNLSKRWCEATLKSTSWSKKSWHRSSLGSGHPEKYGTSSDYIRINKLEEPHIWHDFMRALDYVKLATTSKILSIGCNQGDELFAIWQKLSEVQRESSTLLGIDHCETAIECAQQKYPQLMFSVADARTLTPEYFGDLDLLVALNVLQSPSLSGHHLFKTWVKSLLNATAAVIIGLPNCRYHGHELRFGAVTKHTGYTQDSSLVLSDVQFYTRYLRQQGFTVIVQGHYTQYIVARRQKNQKDRTSPYV
jgi:trans-aconitate methyltransferase